MSLNTIDFLLLGRNGSGKSATGNSILRKKHFFCRSNSLQEMTKPIYESCERQDARITVVDSLNIREAAEKADYTNVKEALEKNGGFSALLILLKFGDRFSEEDWKVVESAKSVLGDDVWRKFGIFVLTGGDNFKREAEEGDQQLKDVEDWIGQQKGKIRDLYDECGRRIVLFDNMTRDFEEKQAQVNKLIKHASDLLNRNGDRYTLIDFEAASKDGKVLQISKTMRVKRQTEDLLRSTRQELTALEQMDCSVDRLDDLAKALKDHLATQCDTLDEASSECISIKVSVEALLAEIKSLIKKQELKTQMSASGTKTAFSSVKIQNVGKTTEREIQIENVETMATPTDGMEQLNLLVFGREGSGKSATANAILGRRAFLTSKSLTSASNHASSPIQRESCQSGSTRINILEVAMMKDSKGNRKEHCDHIIKEATEIVSNNISALIIVVRYDVEFSRKDMEFIEIIKDRLGNDILKRRGVCVVTRGDSFEIDFGDITTFERWCRGQNAKMSNIFAECDYRCVLFNNVTRESSVKEKQVHSLLSLIKFL